MKTIGGDQSLRRAESSASSGRVTTHRIRSYRVAQWNEAFPAATLSQALMAPRDARARSEGRRHHPA